MFENEDLTDQTTDPTDATAPQEPQGDAQEPLESTEAPVEGGETPDALEGDSEDPETFPREYVVKLRKENAGFRERAKRADDLAQRLHAVLVESTGRLADSRDLPFDDAHLDDSEALQQAIQTLLTERPHLASRKPAGNIGQGVVPIPDTVSLGGLLRAGAK